MIPQKVADFSKNPRLAESDRDNEFFSLVEVDTKKELTAQSPDTRVSSATEEGESIAEISPDIVSEKFRDFLIKDKGMAEGAASEVGSYLEEFIQQHVPEIDAIRSLREQLRQGYKLPEKTYSQAKAEDPSLTAKQWFDDHYKVGVLTGFVKSQTAIRENDPSFPNTFNREKPDGLTLGETITAVKEPKYAACRLVIGANQETVDRFLEGIPSGKPTHISKH
jgi:hypothetical protein